jgi:hypothetical protein
MTISSTTVRNSYSGDGTTDTFTYNFKIFQDSDIQVIIRSANGTETIKTITTHYTVTDAGVASGGTVVFTPGNIPTATETVVLRRNIPQTQEIDYIANDPFPAESHEEALDRATDGNLNKFKKKLTRSLKLSKTNTMTSTEFTVGAADRANKILAFDASGEISVTQELGTYRGTDTTITTEAYVQRDIVKSTSATQLNNVYICVGDSVVGDLLTDTDHFDLLVDAVSAAASATAAASSATDAETAQTAAETAQTAAELAETNAETAETNASASASAAAASAASAATLLDNFDDIYLGSFATDPTVDNDGDPLTAGDLYFNTGSSTLQVYSGSAWQTAAISSTGFVTLTGVETLTNKTLTAPKIANAGFIADANGNEQIKFTTTASAVNELTVTNNATGNNPIISATGGDTNIGIVLTPKGTGEVVIATDDLNYAGTAVTATGAELNYNDLATLGTTAASKVFTADANNLTIVSGAVVNVEDILTDDATITWDVIDSPVAKVTLGGNRTLSAPSGTTPFAGQFVSLLIIQDGTGGRTVTWNAVYEFAADTAPTLTATASLGDLFTFRYNGAKWLEVGRNLALTLS